MSKKTLKTVKVLNPERKPYCEYYFFQGSLLIYLRLHVQLFLRKLVKLRLVCN